MIEIWIAFCAGPGVAATETLGVALLVHAASPTAATRNSNSIDRNERGIELLLLSLTLRGTNTSKPSNKYQRTVPVRDDQRRTGHGIQLDATRRGCGELRGIRIRQRDRSRAQTKTRRLTLRIALHQKV